MRHCLFALALPFACPEAAWAQNTPLDFSGSIRLRYDGITNQYRLAPPGGATLYGSLNLTATF